MKKICIVTGSRAEYGLLRPLISLLKKSLAFDVQIVVTGMHLNHEYGSTWKTIENDGYEINKKVEMLVGSDSANAITKSVGLGIIGFADAFQDMKPDLVVLLGDRFEILSAAVSSLLNQIPVAHIHGGELTHGAYDDEIRHAITKMSSLHFVATDEYRARVIQMGESPSSVWTVGGLGIDSINEIDLMSKHELEQNLKFKFGRKNFLVTFHPETSTHQDVSADTEELLSALSVVDANIIFTAPNADTKGHIIYEKLSKYVIQNSHRACLYKSLGQRRYFSALKYVDAVIGNSSSGLLEVPSFKKPTINIGSRQKGRLIADSVICCEASSKSILRALEYAFTREYQSNLMDVINPYGDGGASERILEILEKLQIKNVKKTFHDLGEVIHAEIKGAV